MVALDLREQCGDPSGVAASQQGVLARFPLARNVAQLLAELAALVGLGIAREQKHAHALSEHALASGEVDDASVARLPIERALDHELAREQQRGDCEKRADVTNSERTR